MYQALTQDSLINTAITFAYGADDERTFAVRTLLAKLDSVRAVVSHVEESGEMVTVHFRLSIRQAHELGLPPKRVVELFQAKPLLAEELGVAFAQTSLWAEPQVSFAL